MASTTFSNGVTLTDAAWFQDVNDLVYAGTAAAGNTQDGSFTATLTGVVGTVTYTVKYTKIGNVVTISFAGIAATGTSNATTKTFTGMPAGIRPAATITFPCMCNDNGAGNVIAIGQIAASGVISFNASITAAWTAAGTAIIVPFPVSYSIL